MEKLLCESERCQSVCDRMTCPRSSVYCTESTKLLSQFNHLFSSNFQSKAQILVGTDAYKVTAVLLSSVKVVSLIVHRSITLAVWTFDVLCFSFPAAEQLDPTHDVKADFTLWS